MNSHNLFQTIGNKERLVDRVVEEVTNLIAEQKLQPGMKLPPERDLAEQIGVSRTVIREAVQILNAMGLVESKQGIGTIVRPANTDHLSGHLSMLVQTRGFSLDNLHQVRTTLEVEIAGLAAEQASEEEITELTRIVDRMEAVINDPIQYTLADTEFHRCLAKISHNPLLVLLLDSITEILREIRLSVAAHPSISAIAMPDHRRILEQVRSRDMNAARETMRIHLEHARSIQDQVIKQNSTTDIESK